jgi:phosphate-selective porin OprO and OprP
MDVRVRRDEGPTLGFNGWYVQTAWSITGEPRPYREDRGVFDGVRPARNFGDGGWGAWELAARYSGMDLSDEDIDGGRQRSASLGLNFYPNPMLRASANVIQVLDVDGGPFDGDTPTLWQLRLQLGY